MMRANIVVHKHAGIYTPPLGDTFGDADMSNCFTEGRILEAMIRIHQHTHTHSHQHK